MRENKQTKTIRIKRAMKGFTIVELLIVVVVIAILAAITIVSYNGITQRAQDATLMSQSKDLEKKVEFNKTALFSGNYAPLRASGTGNGPVYANRAALLEGMELKAFGDKLCIEQYDQTGQPSSCSSGLVEGQVTYFDKNKIHFSAGGSPSSTYIRWAYWSNAKKSWQISTRTTNNGSAASNEYVRLCTPQEYSQDAEFTSNCTYQPFS